MKYILITLILSLVACNKTMETHAEAVLRSKSGSNVIGKVMFKQYGNKVTIITDVEGLSPNQAHGFHIHETGDCSAADGTSAGGHFAPNEHKHGAPSDEKHHAGDLGNLEANNSGIAKKEFASDEITLNKKAKNSIIGKAVIIHAKSDDLKSQPSGSAGKRIACGVIEV